EFNFMEVDPLNPLHLLLASDKVWSSANSGKAWNASSLTPKSCCQFAMAFDPTNSNIVYAAREVAFKSTDGGKTFKLLSSKLPTPVTRIVVDEKESSTVFFVVPSYGTPLQGIFKSTDGGNIVVPANKGIPRACSDCKYFDVADLFPLAAKGAYLAVTSNGTIFQTSNSGEQWEFKAKAPVRYAVDRIYADDAIRNHLFAHDELGKLVT